MQKIIWVFGSSASGKETFITSLMKDEALQNLYGITNAQIATCRATFDNLGDLRKLRESINNEVKHLLEENEVILIKWQYGDTLLKTPEKLQKKYPENEHIVIVLHVDHKELVRRLRIKSWWHDIGKEDEFITKELQLVSRSIKSLGADFIIKKQQW